MGGRVVLFLFLLPPFFYFRSVSYFAALLEKEKKRNGADFLSLSLSTAAVTRETHSSSIPSLPDDQVRHLATWKTPSWPHPMDPLWPPTHLWLRIIRISAFIFFNFCFFYFFHPPVALFLAASFSPRFPLWLIRRTSKKKQKKRRNEAKIKRIFCRRNICFCECVRLTLKIKSMSEPVKPSNTQ